MACSPFKTIGEILVKAIVGCVLVGLVSAATWAAEPAAPAGTFVLTSPAFEDNGHLAKKFAGNDKTNANCVGENISPPLSWSNAPKETKSFALMLVDPE